MNTIENLMSNGSTEIDSLRAFPENSVIVENGIENNRTVMGEISATEVRTSEQLVLSVSQPPPIYQSALIDLSVDIPEPVPLLEMNDKIIFSRGNISAISGKAKSRKTFLTKLLAAEILAGNGKVIMLDTEMAVPNVYETARSVHRMMGWDENLNNERLMVFSVREKSIAERREILKVVIADHHPEIVFLDGIRELVSNINCPSESTVVMNLLMKLTTQYDCHICSVLHKNKKDANLRGHLGTELINKSETVINVTDVGNNTSTVEPEQTRHLSFDKFSFFINEDGQPQYCDTLANTEINSSSEIDKNEEMRQMFDVILSDSAMSHGNLCKGIMLLGDVALRTANRRIETAKKAGIISQNENGKYYVPKDVSVEVDDDEPLTDELAEELSSIEKRPIFGDGVCPY